MECNKCKYNKEKEIFGTAFTLCRLQAEGWWGTMKIKMRKCPVNNPPKKNNYTDTAVKYRLILALEEKGANIWDYEECDRLMLEYNL
jgi:hypothetical protein